MSDMTRLVRISILLCSTVLLFGMNVHAQSGDWTIKKSKINNTDVKYQVEKIDGQRTLFYEASMLTDISVDQLKQFLVNFDNHKLFLESTPKSHLIETLAPNKWTAYFYFDAPWPVKNSDNAVTFELKEKADGFVLYGISTPNAYPMQDVKRMQEYEIEYKVSKLDNGLNQLSLVSKVQPDGSVPNFLLKKWFPNGPAEMLDKIVKAIQNAS